MKKGYSAKVVNEIVKNLDTRLIDFYNNNVGKSKLYPKVIDELVRDIIENDLNSETDSGRLNKMLKNKIRVSNQKKKRMYENCCAMVENESWKTDDIERYCFKNDVMNYQTFDKQTWDLVYHNKTFEETQRDRLKEIEKWRDNDDMLMIEYPGLEKRTVKQVFTNLKLDLATNILTLIGELYQFNIEDLTFAVMNDFTDKAIFSPMKERMPLNKNTFIIYTSEDGRRRTQITFNEDIINETGIAPTFDEQDSNIISYLLKASLNNVEDTQPILIQESKLVKAQHGNSNHRVCGTDYDALEKRLKMLSGSTIETYVDNEWQASYHILDAIEKKKIGNTRYLEYYPSNYMTNQIEENRISRLPTEQKNMLETGIARLLFYMMMNQRVRNYKKRRQNGRENTDFDVDFKYEHFLRYANFGSGNRKDNHEEIMVALEDYKSKRIFVKDYKYIAKFNVYRITFYKLSDIEIEDIDYYFGEDSSIEQSSEIIKQLDIFSFIPES